MSKLIKLQDEVYLLLKGEADSNSRTIAGQVKHMLKNIKVISRDEFEDLEKKGIEVVKQVRAYKNWCKEHDCLKEICKFMKHKG